MFIDLYTKETSRNHSLETNRYLYLGSDHLEIFFLPKYNKTISIQKLVNAHNSHLVNGLIEDMRQKLIGIIINSNPDAIFAQELRSLIELEKQSAFRTVRFFCFFYLNFNY